MAKDVIEYANEKHKVQPIEALVRPVLFVPESMDVADLLKEFQKANRRNGRRRRRARRSVSGLVTMRTSSRRSSARSRTNTTPRRPGSSHNAPDDYTVSGGVEVEEMEEMFDLELADDDFITVGGLIPRPGTAPGQGRSSRCQGAEVRDPEHQPEENQKDPGKKGLGRRPDVPAVASRKGTWKKKSRKSPPKRKRSPPRSRRLGRPRRKRPRRRNSLPRKPSLPRLRRSLWSAGMTRALLGRPTWASPHSLNAFLGQKIAIVSDKPQTTRISHPGHQDHRPRPDHLHRRIPASTSPSTRSTGG